MCFFEVCVMIIGWMWFAFLEVESGMHWYVCGRRDPGAVAAGFGGWWTVSKNLHPRHFPVLRTRLDSAKLANMKEETFALELDTCSSSQCVLCLQQQPLLYCAVWSMAVFEADPFLLQVGNSWSGGIQPDRPASNSDPVCLQHLLWEAHLKSATRYQLIGVWNQLDNYSQPARTSREI